METLKRQVFHLNGLSSAALSTIFASLDMRSAGSVEGIYNVSEMDDVRFIHARTNGGRYEVQHRTAHIEPTAESYCFACLPLSTAIRLRQGGRDCVLAPGDLGLVDTRQEYTIDVPSGGSSIWVRFGSSRLEARLPSSPDVFARRIDGTAGIGHLASRFIRSVADETDRVPARSQTAIATMAADLVSEAAACSLTKGKSFRSSSQRTLERARIYIDQHLDRDDLTPAHIARGLGISPRYLSQLFATAGETPMGCVSRRRLRRCRERLERETWRPGLITDMAFACGFTNVSSFNRVFKAAFGVTPRQVTPRTVPGAGRVQPAA